MKPTYRIDTMGGPLARWLPSLEVAKERYIASTMEGWRDSYADDGEPDPIITFEPEIDESQRPSVMHRVYSGRGNPASSSVDW